MNANSIWKPLQKAGGVIGLAGISDGFIAWKGFIIEIVNTYQAITYPFFRFITSWVPMEIPDVVFDYAFFSIITFSVTVNVFHTTVTGANKIRTWLSEMALTSFVAIIWPISIPAIAIVAHSKPNLNDGFLASMVMALAKDFLQWLYSLILIFLVLVIINTIMSKW